MTAGWAGGGGGGFTSRHHARHRIPAPRASLNTATPQLRVNIFLYLLVRAVHAVAPGAVVWQQRTAPFPLVARIFVVLFYPYHFGQSVGGKVDEIRDAGPPSAFTLAFSTTRQWGFPGDFSFSLSPEERAGEQMEGQCLYSWAATRDERCGAPLLATLGPQSGVVPATLTRATCTKAQPRRRHLSGRRRPVDGDDSRAGALKMAGGRS